MAAILSTLRLSKSENQNAQATRIAVQGIEDPFFFGLFASILMDLLKRKPIWVDFLQIRSINGAIGTGLKAKLARSWVIAYLFNNQWARANRGLIGEVTYRSQPFFWALGRHKDRRLALQLWDEMKGLGHPDQLRAKGIQIGDLVIDSYLRFRPSPRFDINDPFVFMILQQAVRDLDLAFKYFSKSRPRLYLSSYSTYIEHGIPARVAVSIGINVRVYGNFVKFGKKLSANDTYHTADTSQYRLKFEALTNEDKDAALRSAHKQLKHRLSGGIDSATSYMSVSAYSPSGEDIPNVAGAIVIFLHDFYDSPHIFPDLIFPDFWTWVCFTTQTLSDAGIPFCLKPHPNQILLSKGVLLELKQLFPQVHFISSKINNAELANGHMACGVTVYGTVAHELAYFGIPTITCARHPHASFGFCRTAKTVDEYRQMLLSPSILPLSKEEMQRQALAFYYMHNLYGTREEQDLKIAFIHFWKTCNAVDPNPELIRKSLLKLKSIPEWSTHLSKIINGLENHEY